MPHSRTSLADEDIDAATAVLRTGEISESEQTRELESEFAEFLGRRHAWATASGTTALYGALLCLEIGEGDEVLVPTYVCDDVLSAVIQSGAEPVPVDLDPDDLNPDPADAAARVTPRTRAAVLAHNLGMPARVGEFEDAGLAVIEDCAHGLGGSLGEQPAGGRGTATVLSFHGLKMITVGAGGMVLTDSDEMAGRYGRMRDPDFAAGEYRLHSRLTNPLAAIALKQLARLGETVELRRSLVGRYLDGLADVDAIRPAETENADGRRSSCYRFAVVTDGNLGFDDIEAAFLDRGVIVRRPVKQLCHRTLGLDPGDFPQAEALFDRVVSLPLYPDLMEPEQDTVIAAAREVFA